jgi:hypothetical protein
LKDEIDITRSQQLNNIVTKRGKIRKVVFYNDKTDNNVNNNVIVYYEDEYNNSINSVSFHFSKELTENQQTAMNNALLGNDVRDLITWILE